MLITPHSNAGIERVFSLVNKSKPKGSDRNCMKINGTFTSIVSVKIGLSESACTCCNFNPGQKFFKSTEEPTRAYNEEYSNKQSNSNAEI